MDKELPREWRELWWILIRIKKCRESGDVEGDIKWAQKLVAWKDAHPEEAKIVLNQIKLVKTVKEVQ